MRLLGTKAPAREIVVSTKSSRASIPKFACAPSVKVRTIAKGITLSRGTRDSSSYWHTGEQVYGYAGGVKGKLLLPPHKLEEMHLDLAATTVRIHIAPLPEWQALLQTLFERHLASIIQMSFILSRRRLSEAPAHQSQ